MSATGVSLDLLRELRAICGDQHVSEDNKTSAIAASPASADEVAAIVRLANQHGFSIAPVGGHEDAVPLSKVDVLLRMHRLTEVEHYDPADLTVGIGAGTTVAQLNALVAGGKLMFGCDPAFPELSTIGGVLAAAKHGPLRQGFGGVRDFCIGIRFVTGDGRKAKGGGRVVKSVAGYDLMKLLIGSCGTLAVITSASFKLFPAPRQTRTFLAEFAAWQEALKFRDQVVRSPLSPMCLEIVSPAARKMMRPEMTGDAWVICVRAAGSDAVLNRYRRELGAAITREVEDANEGELWRALENFPFRSTAEWVIPSYSVNAPPAQLDGVLTAVDGIRKDSGCSIPLIGRAGIGHLCLAQWPPSPEAAQRIATTAYDFDANLLAALPAGCSASKSPAGDLCLPASNNAALGTANSMRAVKQALDPNNVLRGRELF